MWLLPEPLGRDDHAIQGHARRERGHSLGREHLVCLRGRAPEHGDTDEVDRVVVGEPREDGVAPRCSVVSFVDGPTQQSECIAPSRSSLHAAARPLAEIDDRATAFDTRRLGGQQELLVHRALAHHELRVEHPQPTAPTRLLERRPGFDIAGRRIAKRASDPVGRRGLRRGAPPAGRVAPSSNPPRARRRPARSSHPDPACHRPARPFARRARRGSHRTLRPARRRRRAP